MWVYFMGETLARRPQHRLPQPEGVVGARISPTTGELARSNDPDAVFELFMALHATDEQLDFPVVYASAKMGYAKVELQHVSGTMEPLFDAIIKHIPPPRAHALQCRARRLSSSHNNRQLQGLRRRAHRRAYMAMQRLSRQHQ